MSVWPWSIVTDVGDTVTDGAESTETMSVADDAIAGGLAPEVTPVSVTVTQ